MIFFKTLSFHGETKTNLIIRLSHLTGRITEQHILILLPPLASKTTLNYERSYSENLLYELFNEWIWKAGTLTYNKSLITDVSKCRCLTNDLSKMKTKPIHVNRFLTTNSRWIETDQWPMTNLTQVLQPLSWRLYWPITFNGPLFDQSLLMVTPLTDKHYSLLLGLVIHKKITLTCTPCMPMSTIMNYFFLTQILHLNLKENVEKMMW